MPKTPAAKIASKTPAKTADPTYRACLHKRQAKERRGRQMTRAELAEVKENLATVLNEATALQDEPGLNSLPVAEFKGILRRLTKVEMAAEALASVLEDVEARGRTEDDEDAFTATFVPEPPPAE